MKEELVTIPVTEITTPEILRVDDNKSNSGADSVTMSVNKKVKISDIPKEIMAIDPMVTETPYPREDSIKKEDQVADTIIRPDSGSYLEDPDVDSIAQPKKKGRPVGAKSKEPGKPRAKRIPKKPLEVAAVTANIEATDTVRIGSGINDDMPRVLERSQPIPQYSHDDTSELLLRLLSHQANQRKRNKVDLWKSWFK